MHEIDRKNTLSCIHEVWVKITQAPSYKASSVITYKKVKKEFFQEVPKTRTQIVCKNCIIVP